MRNILFCINFGFVVMSGRLPGGMRMPMHLRKMVDKTDMLQLSETIFIALKHTLVDFSHLTVR